MKPSTKTPNHDVNEIVTFLNTLLADEYVLYTKTRNAHWNVDGPNGYELHVFFENQYNAMDEVIDDVAERIRSLGHFALISLKEFLNASRISEENHDFNNSMKIIQSLVNDHEKTLQIIRKDMLPISSRYKELGIDGFVTNLMERHEKMARMHRTFIAHPDDSAIELY